MRDLRDLNLNSLRIVESAARTGSFVRAAEENLLTPSAVSQRVKNLESQLRFKIFNRRNNSVILTTEGDIFIAHVREALDIILSAGLEVRSLDRDKMLKISALPTFNARWLLRRLGDFKDKEPDICLNLANSYAPANFSKEDFDLAVRYGNGDFPGLESRLLFEEDLTPLCAPGLLEGRGAKNGGGMTPEDLAQFTLLHSETCMMNWKYWLEQTRAQDVLKQAKAMYFDSCMLSYEAATSGLGFAIANCAYMMGDIESGKLVAPFGVHLRSGSGWYIVYPKTHGRLPRVKAFVRWILGQARSSEAQVDRVFTRR